LLVKPIKIKTGPWPSFATDNMPLLLAVLSTVPGRSQIEETIFSNRFMAAPELNRMGAKILIKGNRALIDGNTKFAAAELMATDLRASVSLVLAALSTKGKSLINRIYHLDRGYENIEKKLQKIGAKIRRIN